MHAPENRGSALATLPSPTDSAPGTGFACCPARRGALGWQDVRATGRSEAGGREEEDRSPLVLASVRDPGEVSTCLSFCRLGWNHFFPLALSGVPRPPVSQDSVGDGLQLLSLGCCQHWTASLLSQPRMPSPSQSLPPRGEGCSASMPDVTPPGTSPCRVCPVTADAPCCF